MGNGVLRIHTHVTKSRADEDAAQGKEVPVGSGLLEVRQPGDWANLCALGLMLARCGWWFDVGGDILKREGRTAFKSSVCCTGGFFWFVYFW